MQIAKALWQCCQMATFHKKCAQTGKAVKIIR